MHVTFTPGAVLSVKAAVTLETTRRAAYEAYRRVQWHRLAALAHHDLVLIQIKVVKHKREFRKAVYRGVVQHDATIQLRGSV